MATVSVQVEATPKGELVEVPGLGTVENYGTKEVDETQIALYENLGYTFPTDGKLVVKLPPDPVEALQEEPKEALLTRAAELEIEGRSSMNKTELAKAIAKAEGAK